MLVWTEETEKGTLHLYIAGEGGVNGAEACRVLFHGYTALESVHFNNSFFTDTATDMHYMFYLCKNLKSLDMDGLNTGNVTDMGHMFSDCRYLATLNVSGLDTSKVTNMGSMFSSCGVLKSLDLSNFDTAQVIDMEYMFYGCRQLTDLDISSFDTSNVNRMDSMFRYCTQLSDLDLSHFDTSSVTLYQDFMGPGKTVNGRPWQELFEQGPNNASSNPPIDPLAWQKNVLMADTSFDEDHSKFWSGRDRAYLEEIDAYFSKRPIFNTGIARSKVTEVFFLNTLSTAPKKVYDVSTKQDKSVLAWTEETEKGTLHLYIAGEGGVNGAEACRVLFYGYTALESVHFNNSFFTDTTTDMSYMFAQCKNLKSLDMDGLNTENVTDMRCMFNVCLQLTTLDISGLDTSKVTNMGSMFSSCGELKSLDLSNFDTAQVTDMEYMFYGCRQLTDLDISSFDTSNVFRMNNMFRYCTQLSDLDLSHFDTSGVTLYQDFMDPGKTVNGRPWEELFQ